MGKRGKRIKDKKRRMKAKREANERSVREIVINLPKMDLMVKPERSDIHA